MIVHTEFGVVVVTDHALTRFQQRVNHRASGADVAEALLAAEFVEAAPAWVSIDARYRHGAHGWFVGERWVMPVQCPNDRDRERGFDFKAVTCMVKGRRSKAEVRAWRERRAEEQWAS